MPTNGLMNIRQNCGFQAFFAILQLQQFYFAIDFQNFHVIPRLPIQIFGLKKLKHEEQKFPQKYPSPSTEGFLK